ncbi:hypothetical protein DFH08DRAFT_886128 [Mycena albidolilacea]|uniref:Secreted protein n=1 Tax=Mycena albidolilacea TaxID=1033008 RepID=A0AAD6ZIZ0_9AGAR|nr:hypothetical protein DFH08DRAFT_886128 [Mycena albidolilacea]
MVVGSEILSLRLCLLCLGAGTRAIEGHVRGVSAHGMHGRAVVGGAGWGSRQTAGGRHSAPGVFFIHSSIRCSSSSVFFVYLPSPLLVLPSSASIYPSSINQSQTPAQLATRARSAFSHGAAAGLPPAAP